MTEFWLVRHGQTDWNLAGRWQGQSPCAPGLNTTGRVQAFAASERLSAVRFSAVYSSDLLRSFQTAELLAEPLGLSINLEPRLREINLGDWEGMFSNEIEARYEQELEARARDPFNAHAPNGESPREVADRVLRTINEIANKHSAGPILIVSHGVSLAVIICHNEGHLMQKVYEHIPENGQPYCVQWDPRKHSILGKDI